jgi:hypothetical protein
MTTDARLNRTYTPLGVPVVSVSRYDDFCGACRHGDTRTIFCENDRSEVGDDGRGLCV